MRSTNHRKYPTRSYRNDHDFASFGDSSASVLLTRNAARFDGEFSATGQLAPAESILSGRAIAPVRVGYMHGKQGPESTSCRAVSDSELERGPVSCYRPTLFDSVMDFLDRHDRMAASQQSSMSAEQSVARQT
jgi:hypothetical protein